MTPKHHRKRLELPFVVAGSARFTVVEGYWSLSVQMSDGRERCHTAMASQAYRA
jgi:hypothetical protein